MSGLKSQWWQEQLIFLSLFHISANYICDGKYGSIIKSLKTGWLVSATVGEAFFKVLTIDYLKHLII